MPPTLRSTTSAQNSPSSNKPSMNLRSSNTTPSTTPTRKVPQCSKCRRPRAGHPRTGCPFTDSPPMNNSNLANTADSQGHLTDALGSMIIATPDSADQEEDQDTKTFIRNRRRKSAQPLLRNESLLSLSTNSNEIIMRLSQPGIFNDDTEEAVASDGKGKASRIVRWQETIAATPIAAKRTTQSKTPGVLMPGTLILPTPESSFASSRNESFLKTETPSTNVVQVLRDEPTMELESSEGQSPSSASQSTVTRRAEPLSRTMSAEERDLFVSKLSGEAPATIYIVPKADVDAIVSQATALKFITELVMNEDDEDPNALIVLGREENAVQSLLRKIEKENRKTQKSKPKGSSTLKTAAGAAVVGAVGAWAGLAFT